MKKYIIKIKYLIFILGLFSVNGCSKFIVPLPFLGWSVVEEGSGNYDKEDGKQYPR